MDGIKFSGQLDTSIRKCKVCKIEKKLTNFRKNKESKYGYRNICKQCYNLQNKKIPISEVGYQFCRKCSIVKKLEEFEPAKNCKSGYRYRCKECRRKLYIKKPRTNNKGWFKKGHKQFNIYYKNCYKKGIRNSPATEFKKGHRSWNYIDGKSSEYHYKLTNNKRYCKIRKLVKERDNHMCSKCGNIKNLHVHHIVPLRKNPDLSHDINNLITLCALCHVREERRLHAN